jgi:hypothetical protein
MIEVEVAYATPERQEIVIVSLAAGASVAEAIDASGIRRKFPELSLGELTVGLFAKPCRLDQALAPGDRVEIYRPLLNDPKDARRQRAKISNKRG